MNISAHQTVVSSAPKLISFNEGGSLTTEIDNLKVSELRFLLALSTAKIGSWVPLATLRGDRKQSSSFSRFISKLTDDQWIATKKDPEDGRGKQIRLTIKGRHRLKPLFSNTQQKVTPETPSKLPQTSRKHFFTAKTALNIPSKEGTGDWHFFEMFQGSHGRMPGPFFIAGENIEDTYSILGDLGVHECSSLIRDAGVEVNIPIFAANHYRAMGDLIYQRLHENKSLQSLRADDWFPTKTDRDKLAYVLHQLAPSLKEEQLQKLNGWMKEQDVG